jgi:glycosyltransferase involved in cell wall biosynthesis
MPPMTSDGSLGNGDAAPAVSERSGFPLRGTDVVCLSTIDWDFLWQGHQEIMNRLARRGNRVIFVENIGGVRSVHLSDSPRLLHRAFRSLRHARISSPAATGPRFVSPLILPFPGSRIAWSINALLIQRLARGIQSQARSGDQVVFTYLPSREAVSLVRLLRRPRSVVVYYCVADFRELADDANRIVASENELVRMADLVFVQSAAFARRFSGMNESIFEFPGGVNLDRLDPSGLAGPPREIAYLSHPIIGYIGGLHDHIDVPLLSATARALPSASIVLVGPIMRDIAELRSEPNIHVLGARSASELTNFIGSFDVGLIPYVLTPYTETVRPTKLFEYLAMGKPVVTTPLPEVVRLGLPMFAARVAKDASGFVQAIQMLIAEDRVGAAADRRDLARSEDWEAVVERMAHLIADAMRRK